MRSLSGGPGGSQRRRLSRLWHDYSLSLVVGALFVASFLLHVIFGWWQYAADQTAQGQVPTVWGGSGFLVYFGEWTFQNWQSEFLEVLVLIVATAYLVHRGSHESKDGEDEMKAALARIERRVGQVADQVESTRRMEVSHATQGLEREAGAPVRARQGGLRGSGGPGE